MPYSQYFITLVTFLLALSLWGCQEEPQQQTASPGLLKGPVQTAQGAKSAAKPSFGRQTGQTALFDAPIEPVVVELPPEALPYWRDAAAGSKPALVLFSIHPLLDQIEDSLKPQVARLLEKGSQNELQRHGSIYRAEPLILPTQALSAAVEAGLFSEIIWVFPSTASPDQMQFDLFRKQVTEAGFLTDEEGETLHLDGGVYSGTVRGVPFRAAHPAVLPDIDKPMILHVDLGYFKGLYQGEVKTRIYDLLLNTALALNETGWQPILTTLSYSTFEGTFSLDVRFLITNFADMLRDPALLDGTMPQSWALRSEALYAVNFFLEDKVQEYYEQAARDYPDDAATQFDLYKHLFFEQRKIDEALAVLDKAVSLDRGYAAAYLELAQIANDDGNLAAALELLSNAAPLVPENPMVNLYRAQFLIESSRKEEAIPLIKNLQQLTWSTYYHTDIPALLEQMLNDEISAPASDTPSQEQPKDDPTRQRILN
jgi:tetratricopeptide (TPR) repeat protein